MLLQSESTKAKEIPFDPTVADQKEHERLNKVKWLPPIADIAKLKISANLKNKHSLISKIGKTESKKDHIFVGSNGDRFPKSELRKSEHAKKTVKLNPKAKFIMPLHEKSLLESERLKKKQLQREMVVDAYDWNVIKQISHEPQFLKYIEGLKSRGNLIKQEILDDWNVKDEATLNLDSDNHSKSQTNLNRKQSEQKINSRRKEKELPPKDYLERIQFYIKNSAFRPKLKGALSMRRQYPNPDPNHSFGRPKHFAEEFGVEFNRLFGELDQLGNTVGTRKTLVDQETEIFTIPPTIAAAIEAMQGNKAIYGKGDKKKDQPTVADVYKMSNARRLEREFNLDRSTLQKQLIKYLRTRAKERLIASNNLDTITEIQKVALDEVDKFIQSGKIFRTENPKVPNLW
ncbi:hypothetical protein BC833DRAFT_608564 [Globomyces pollinis-pini]|nr:hypothetical protein BC833DRAFT_608564 [Globomyces pollinis-pini]